MVYGRMKTMTVKIVFILIVLIFGFILIIHNTYNTKVKHECVEWFNDSMVENLRVISEYPRDNITHILEEIRSHRKTPSVMTSFPVIVTAASAYYYEISLGLLESIHTLILPRYKDVKIVYYDLGLEERQVNELKTYYKCEVRKFPFADYPTFIRTVKYHAWKPIIVQKLLMEYGWVWWMDSSIRFTSAKLDTALQYSRDQHFLFFSTPPRYSVAHNTNLLTMEFLNETSCKFRYFGMAQANFILFHFDDVTSVVVDAWCACALSLNCIAPPGSILNCDFDTKYDGECHRFDQSILSIILRRLYYDRNDFPLKRIAIHAER